MQYFFPGSLDEPAGKPQTDTVAVVESVVAAGLDVPWEITWGPDDWIWLTEQKGLVRRVNPQTGETQTVIAIADVHMQRAVGLLGLAFHPDQKHLPFVFVDYSYMDGSDLFLKVVRYRYHNGGLTEPVVLLERIPATETHNGSRIVFDTTGRILLTTGDIDRGRLSQDAASPNGKILRLNVDGTVPDDNPIHGSYVWSLGHRNPQGLVRAPNGRLYSSEHGDVTDDEINLIEKGRNYGWPVVQGLCDDADREAEFCAQRDVVQPMKTWTPTIAPSGIDFYHSLRIPQWTNSIIVTSLKDASLRILKLDNTGSRVEKEIVYLRKKFGRLRDVCVSPAGDVYISTSNHDWNKTAGSGFPRHDDDRIIKLSPGASVRSIRSQPSSIAQSAGKSVYADYCESCHKPDGNGLPGLFPSLRTSRHVKGGSDIIKIILSGVDTKEYAQAMPSFSFLTNEQVAEVVNYLSIKFTGMHADLRPDDVQKVREAAK
jgi:glucose/arabinose dehydrogenase/mono/diheme cytochrome c family protein